MMEHDLYALLFEHFPPTRVVSQAPLLCFPSSSCTLATLKARVDLVASALSSFGGLDVPELVSLAREGKAEYPRAVLAMQRQEQLDYAVVLLACLKLGIEVAVVDSCKVQDTAHLDDILARSQPLLLFADCAASPSPHLASRTVIVDSELQAARLGSSAPTLASLAEAERSKDGPLRDGRPRQLASGSPANASVDQPGILTFERKGSEGVMSRASQASLVAGVLSTHALISKLAIFDGPRQTTSTALPLHIVSYITLAILTPLFAATPNWIHATEDDIMALLPAQECPHHLWLDSRQAHHLCKQLSLSPRPSCHPTSIAILQPGMGVKSQGSLTSLLPNLALFNGYASRRSTGLLCLANASPSGLLLGSPHGPHRLAVVDKTTGAALPTGHCGQLAIQGPAVMASPHQPNQECGWVVTDERAVMGVHGMLELAYGTSAWDPLTFLEDHIVSHPEVMDCSVALVAGRVQVYASPVQTGRSATAFVDSVTAWAAQGHSYFGEMRGKVQAVKAVVRESLGGAEVEAMESAPALSQSGPQMGLFVNEAAKLQGAAPRPVASARRAKTASGAKTGTAAAPQAKPAKAPVRDSKRRATHSQIERRRREKINDRLITLRTIIPACAAEVEDRKRQKREEEEEARRIAAGEVAGPGAKGKRKRSRRKTTKAGEEDKEDELGLHKLEVLTHTIEYVYELQDRIHQLETGSGPAQTSHRRLATGLDDDDDDDDDDEGSEAHLEMAEWEGIQPSAKRRTSEGANVDFARRRSAISSPSSLGTSPAVMSLSAESPMFSAAAASSSTSVFTSLTSPMMSLSSESPILRWGNQSPGGSSERDKEQPGRGGKAVKGASSSQANDWQLPAPALLLEEKPSQSGKDASSSAQAVHLLLNLSTSPEVLRPMSAIRQSSYTPAQPMRRRQSITAASELKTDKGIGAKGGGGSAPGGAHASSSSTLLNSPPLLALDAPSTATTASAPPPQKRQLDQ